MAINPFYPGYDPSQEKAGYYPGKGMVRDADFVPSMPYVDFNSAFNEVLDDLDNALTEEASGGMGNFPKWVWDRVMDDVHQAFNVATYPSYVDPTVMDDYEEETIPGAYGITVNLDPVNWVKDPEKELKRVFKNATQNILNISDLERRAEDEFWRRTTSANPTQQPGRTTWDYVLDNQARNLAELYGTPNINGQGNPLALEGLSDRVIRDDSLDAVDIDTGWRGDISATGRMNVTLATQPSSDTEYIEISSVKTDDYSRRVDTAHNMRTKLNVFEENLETNLFRGDRFKGLMDATTDFVATDLYNLKNSADWVNPADAHKEFLNGYLAQANVLNRHNETGAAFESFNKSLAKAKVTGALREKPIPDLVKVSEASDLFDKINTEISAIEKTREVLRNNPADLRRFERTIGSLDSDLRHLKEVIGDRDAQGHFNPSRKLKRLLDNPTTANARKFNSELVTHLGDGRTILMESLWGGNTVNPGTDRNLATFVGNSLVMDKRFREIAQKYNLESGRAIFFSRFARSQRDVAGWRELYSRLQKGQISEVYLWNQGLGRMMTGGYVITHPKVIIQAALNKVHNFGLLAGDKKEFDKLFTKRGYKRFSKIFANEFRLKLKTGLTGRIQGNGNLGVVDDLRTLMKTAEGKKALALMLSQNIPLIDKDGNINKRLLLLLFKDGNLPDGDQLEELMKHFKKLQGDIKGFRDWVVDNQSLLGIKNLSDFNTWSDLIEQLGKEADIGSITRSHLGLLEKLTKFGNKLQKWAFDKIPFLGKWVKSVGLAKIAVKNAIRETIQKVANKFLSKAAIQAFMQALGTGVAPVVGNIVAFIATEVAEKIVEKTIGAVKKRLGEAIEFLKSGELPDLMEELDEKTTKFLKKMAIFFIIAMIFIIFLAGPMATLLLSAVGLSPSILGGLLGSATFTSTMNLNSNPYIVILSTIADVDPSRHTAVMEQSDITWDWHDAFPPQNASGTPYTGIGATPGLGIPGMDDFISNAGSIYDIFVDVRTYMGITNAELHLITCPYENPKACSLIGSKAWCYNWGVNGLYCNIANEKFATASPETLTRLFIHELTHTRQFPNYATWPGDVDRNITEWGAEHYSNNGGWYCFTTRAGSLRGTQISNYLLNNGCDPSDVDRAALAIYPALQDLQSDPNCNINLQVFIISRYGSGCDPL